MPTFPLIYLLIPFGLVFALALLFFFFNIFHIKRYAIKSQATTTLLLIYVTGFGILTLLSGLYILSINWNTDVQPGDLLPSFESTNRL